MTADVDLNLLIVLDALLDEESVTHAADRLHMSVPAASRALGQLRRELADPLFVRSGQHLVPTPYALSVREQVHGVVAEARKLMRKHELSDIRTIDRTFRIATNDALFPAGPLLARLRDAAPNSRFAIVPIGTSDVALRDPSLDLAIGIFRDFEPSVHLDPEVIVEPLRTDTLVGIARADHPLLPHVTCKDYLAAEHVVNSRRGALRGSVDHALEAVGLRRSVVASTSTTWSYAVLLRQSDLLGSTNRSVARSLEALGIASFELPLKSQIAVEISQAWHPRNSDDPAHAWLRSVVREIAAQEGDG